MERFDDASPQGQTNNFFAASTIQREASTTALYSARTGYDGCHRIGTEVCTQNDINRLRQKVLLLTSWFVRQFLDPSSAVLQYVQPRGIRGTNAITRIGRPMMKGSEIFRVTQLCLPQIPDTDARHLHDASDLRVQTVCSLWAGMGHIYKVTLPNSSSSKLRQSVQLVIKHVAAPPGCKLQQSPLGDRRKAESYHVEANFYERLAPSLLRDHGLRVPEPYWVEQRGGKAKDEIVIVMSYIQSQRSADLSDDSSVKAVLTWLATLHAAYWGVEKVNEIVKTAGLQQQGSYWYLDTRLEEHESMPNRGWEGRLKRAARAIDDHLQRNPMQCLIHGDVKDANVLLSSPANNRNDDVEPVVTLCDFQYCGRGPPTKDLAYFFCSSANVPDEDAALAFYLEQLTRRLLLTNTASTPPPTMGELRDSLDLAYCDFYRFMSGWGFWGGGSGKGRVQAVLDRLDGGKDLGTEEAYIAAVRREFG